MTGITLLIEQTGDGQLHFESALVATAPTETEERFLACISAALQSCVLQVAGHYKGRDKISYDEVSQRAAAVFQEAVEKLRSAGKNPFEG